MNQKNDSLSTELINRFSRKQKHGWYLCPRCGNDRMNKKIAQNALSRRVDMMICDMCGRIEAIEDIPDNSPLPLEMWALVEHPERFFLRDKDYKEFYFTFGSWAGFPFKNAYIVVEGFDREDARLRFRRRFKDKTPGVACYSFDYTEDSWMKSSMQNDLLYKGTLHLNNSFEEAE